MRRYIIEIASGRIGIRALDGGNLIALGFGEISIWEASFSVSEPDAAVELLRNELWDQAMRETCKTDLPEIV